jgi:quercetin dioxygenase-like cupin family protein
MRKLRLADLADLREGHFLADILPGRYLNVGGMGFKSPGQRTHDHDGPGGTDRHVHAEDREAFVILQGRAVMQVDGRDVQLTCGDVVIIEPGEDHHLVCDPDEPCVNLWLHAGDEPHPDQRRR